MYFYIFIKILHDMLYFIHIVLRKISLFQAHNYVIVRICFTRRLLVCRIIFLFFNFIKRRIYWLLILYLIIIIIYSIPAKLFSVTCFYQNAKNEKNYLITKWYLIILDILFRCLITFRYVLKNNIYIYRRKYQIEKEKYIKNTNQQK